MGGEVVFDFVDQVRYGMKRDRRSAFSVSSRNQRSTRLRNNAEIRLASQATARAEKYHRDPLSKQWLLESITDN